MQTIAEYTLGDMRLAYLLDEATGTAGLRLTPLSFFSHAVEKNCAIEPLVQLKWVGDTYPGSFSQGRTMRGSASTSALRYVRHWSEAGEGEALRILTELADGQGKTALHTVRWEPGWQAVEITTAVRNGGSEALLEMLTSFTLGGLTPFDTGEAPGTMVLHRLLSTWSGEGQLLSQPIEVLQLEPSWLRFSANSLRFGQVGSMPVRGYYPLIGVTDTVNNVTWAASLTHAYSWQMEAYRRDLGLSLSGGIADREFGHFVKRLSPGEAFIAPPAYLTCAAGGIDEAGQRLTTPVTPEIPSVEQDLPVVYNEFCASWGRPDQATIERTAQALRGRGVTYFVIDAGWYSDGDTSWQDELGDWQPSKRLFPQGIGRAADAIRQAGMIPGIWFEFEVCAKGAKLFSREELLLTRDGVPIQSGARRFLDFRRPETLAYLRERVIGFSQAHGFGYMKVDYNETIGIGADGAESQGEALRRQILAVQAFFREVRQAVPKLVLEVCASGGHRIVPSFMEICQMASFSDAHESDEIPVIAAQMHRMIHPWQSQIWAVLRPEMPDAMLYSRLSAAMLGRVCLSGNVAAFSPAQWAVVTEGLAFYRQLVPLLRCGQTAFVHPVDGSLRHPSGFQAVTRQNGAQTAVFLHAFSGCPTEVCLAAGPGARIAAQYMRPGITAALEGENLCIKGLLPMDGLVLLLERKQ